jgi:hypothetical protein
VPNFGMDHEIKSTLETINKAEFDMGHKWVFPTGTKKYHNEAKDTMYDFAPNLDSDMITTAKNLKDTETK